MKTEQFQSLPENLEEFLEGRGIPNSGVLVQGVNPIDEPEVTCTACGRTHAQVKASTPGFNFSVFPDFPGGEAILCVRCVMGFVRSGVSFFGAEAAIAAASIVEEGGQITAGGIAFSWG